MNYQVLDSFRAKTKEGDMELQRGQIITISSDKATKLIDSGKIQSLKDAMTEQYKFFIRWLCRYELTAADVAEQYPDLLKKIHQAIKTMDSCFNNEDYQGFSQSLEGVKSLMTGVERLISRSRGEY